MRSEPLSKKSTDWITYTEVMSPLIGLKLDDEQRSRVAGSLAMAAAAAALVMEFPLDEAADEAAAVFRPGHAR